MSYGRPLGIISLEENIPCPPGTPGNSTTFPHPVCYEIVRGVDVLNANDPDGLQAFMVAGRALVERGACAIAGNCGRMIVYQKELAAALPVPVFLSSLLQLPFIARLYGPDSEVGIIASSSASLKEEHISMALDGNVMRTVITSMDGKDYFCSAVSSQAGQLDFEKVQAEVVAVAMALVAGNPNVKAILFECVDLPPYASAVQEAVGLPVFDITTMIGHAYSALVRKPFVGVY